jgi:hypothetical protein
MEAQARSNAWKAVQDRLQENLANLQKLKAASGAIFGLSRRPKVRVP